ncbi:MAG: serine/threonine-protein kinase [Cyanobacteria bacterium]|nr:serine/threonine-protein kinase [Cyanobacteriota bacterium]MDA0865090.1 serine/threonine-protein kinase [Cyanobacteriota bacterium]
MGGQILGDRYEVKHQLGKKSGRWTLEALDLETQARVILKLIFLDDSLSATDLRLFTREMEALKLLDHPATPRHLNSFDITLPLDGKALALVQSHLPGKSLAQYAQEARVFTQKEVETIARQVLAVLVQLHEQSPPIIHRDIRPSNILLQGEPNGDNFAIALVDFGSVKALNTSTTSFTILGSGGYTPPEQAGGRVLAASDLYSLGATLAEAMTGLTLHQMQGGKLRIRIEEHCQVSEAFATWLKQLMAPSLDHRWSSAQKALAALESL